MRASCEWVCVCGKRVNVRESLVQDGWGVGVTSACEGEVKGDTRVRNMRGLGGVAVAEVG